MKTNGRSTFYHYFYNISNNAILHYGIFTITIITFLHAIYLVPTFQSSDPKFESFPNSQECPKNAKCTPISFKCNEGFRKSGFSCYDPNSEEPPSSFTPYPFIIFESIISIGLLFLFISSYKLRKEILSL